MHARGILAACLGAVCLAPAALAGAAAAAAECAEEGGNAAGSFLMQRALVDSSLQVSDGDFQAMEHSFLGDIAQAAASQERLAGLETRAHKMAESAVARAFLYNASSTPGNTSTTPRVGKNDSSQSGIVANILGMLNRTIFQGMLADHAEDQKEVHSAHSNIGDCLDDLRRTNKTRMQVARSHAKSKSSSEGQCLTDKGTLNTQKIAMCQAAHRHFKTNLEKTGCSLGNEKTAATLKTHLDCVKRFAGRIPAATVEYWKCANATVAYANKSAECDTMKDQKHAGYCVLATEASAACSTYSSCYVQKRSRYLSTKSSVQKVEAGRKTEAVALARIRCYLGVVVKPAWELQSQGASMISNCSQISTAPEESRLTVVYPFVQNATACKLMGDVPSNSSPPGGCPAGDTPGSTAFCDGFQCPPHYNQVAGAELILGSTVPLCCRQQASVSAGRGHSAFVDLAGQVHMAGGNKQGQLGMGPAGSQAYPVHPLGLTLPVIQVSCGSAHTLFLLSDGTVMATGKNSDGQLGDGTTTSRDVPVKVQNIDSVIDLAEGAVANHAVFLRSNKTVWGIGRNDYKQLGRTDGVDTTSPWKIQGIDAPVKKAAVGSYHTVFLMEDGTVKTLGRNHKGQLGIGSTTADQDVPTTVPGISEAVDVAAGDSHTIIVLQDGTVRTVGGNEYGQLGDTTKDDRSTPVSVASIGNVVAAVARQLGTTFLLSNGDVMGTGLNSRGELLDGTLESRTTPVKANGVSNVAKASGGASHILLLLDDGTVRSAGTGTLGQLGTGTSDSTSTNGVATVMKRENVQLTLS